MWVVAGHAAEKSGADAFLLRMSMFLGVAAFFFLSGVTFELGGAGKKTPAQFLRNLCRTLVVPYFAWALISIFVYALAGEMAATMLGAKTRHYAILPNLLGMLYGNSDFCGRGESGAGYMEWNRPLWFLTCLFVVKCTWYLLLRVKGRKGRVLRIAIFAASVCRLILGAGDLRLPWEAETAAGVLWIFGLGMLYAQRGSVIDPAGREGGRSCRRVQLAAGVACVAILLLLLLPAQLADFRADRFTHSLMAIPQTGLGICGILCLAKMLEENRFLAYVGQRTMAVLVMHKFVLIFLKILWKGFHIPREGRLLVPEDLLLTAVTAVICLLAERILAARLPWLFGKRKAV